MADSLAKSRVGIGAGQHRRAAEIVERTQDVVAPTVRMQEAQKPLVCRLTRAETAEEVTLKQIFLARPASLLRFARTPCGSLVFQEPFQHVDRAGG